MTSDVPVERAAVLVGVSDYRHLPPVPAARNSLARMESLLTGELCGWRPQDVHRFDGPESPDGLPAALVDVFRPARQVALFYFVGHGQYDTEDKLCLGLAGTRDEAHRRRVTSLEYDSVRHALRLSSAATKIVILDCCYAGLAAESFARLGTADPLDRLRGTGAILMMACPEHGLAHFETVSPDGKPQTCFTKYLVHAVQHGIAGEGRQLRVGPLFNRVVEDMARAGLPTPSSNVRDHVTDFAFADNAAWLPPAAGQVASAAAAGTAGRAGGSPGAVPAGAVPRLVEDRRRMAEQARLLAAGATGGVLLTAALLHSPTPSPGSHTSAGAPDPGHPHGDGGVPVHPGPPGSAPDAAPGAHDPGASHTTSGDASAHTYTHYTGGTSSGDAAHGVG